MLGEKVGIRRGLAVLVGLVGVMIVLRPGQADLQLGHLAGVTAAVFASLASVIVRKIGQEERSVVLVLYPMVANFLVLGLALPFVYQPDADRASGDAGHHRGLRVRRRRCW